MPDKIKVNAGDETERKRSSGLTNLLFVLLGAGCGAAAALLFAPRAGEELRNDIADSTRKGIDKSREAARRLGSKDKSVELGRGASADLGGDETKEGY
jgi:gas vesicle protein